MHEVTGDLWEFYKQGAHVAITTNGSYTAKGMAVLGRGVALEAKTLLPDLPKQLGLTLKAAMTASDIPVTYFAEWRLFCLPVKWAWFDAADPYLVVRSAERLMTLIDDHTIPHVYTVRPGCGNGWLEWKNVKPLIEDIFDERITIVQR